MVGSEKESKLSGRIKSGEGTLIGNAGEHYVMAELLKRGIIAALAPRNSPAFDILATNPKKTVRIRVKTKSAEYTDWQYVIKKDGSIFRYLQQEGDFTVLVNLSKDIKDMEFFILPTLLLNKWLEEDFERWFSSPPKRGKPHAADNPKRHLIYGHFKEELSKYRNNWDILWK